MPGRGALGRALELQYAQERTTCAQNVRGVQKKPITSILLFRFTGMCINTYPLHSHTEMLSNACEWSKWM